MSKLDELRTKLSETVEQMRKVIQAAESASRDMSEEEERTYAGLDAKVDEIKKAIAREERLSGLEGDLAAPIQQPHRPDTRKGPSGGDDKREFENFGEFLWAARYQPHDPRLEWREARADQKMGTGSLGGFNVPSKFIPDLLMVNPQEAIIRPRATVIPAGDSPDTDVTIPALDQGASGNMYGGVVIYPTGEGATLSQTGSAFKEVTLEPAEQGAYIVSTNKLLRNWSAASALFSNLLRKAIIGYEDDKFYTGTGAGVPLGITQAPCKIAYSRATASQISFADIRGMYARVKFGGSLVWIGSQTILPQILNLQGGNSENIFQADARANVAGTLLGIPLLMADRAPALGTAGDLSLCDLAYYMIKDGFGIAIDFSEHVYFTSNKTVIRAMFSVDGKPWLNEAIPLEGSSSNTISPFVVLT